MNITIFWETEVMNMPMTYDLAQQMHNAIGATEDEIMAAANSVRHRDAFRRGWKKEKGKRRPLTIPNPHLMKVLRQLSAFLLSVYDRPDSVVALKGTDIVTTAYRHLKFYPTIMWSCDLKSAYPTVSKDMVYKVLSKAMQRYLPGRLFEAHAGRQMVRWFTEMTTYNNQLPQGAPTSGTILNMYLRQFDLEMETRLRVLEIEHGTPFVYTRYIDDLVITSRQESVTPIITQGIADQINKVGMKRSWKKTKCSRLSTGRSMELHGLRLDIDGQTVSLSKDLKSRINQRWIDLLSGKEQMTKETLKAVVQGYILFLTHVYEVHGESYRLVQILPYKMAQRLIELITRSGATVSTGTKKASEKQKAIATI